MEIDLLLGGTPYSIASISSSSSSSFTNIDLTQEMVVDINRQNILIMKQKLECKLKKENEHPLALIHS